MRSRAGKIAALFALASTLAFAPPAAAETFDVDSTADNDDALLGDGVCDDGTGHCTLRAAMNQLRVNGDPLDRDRINLPAGNYLLTHGSGQLGWDDASDTLEIVGAGSASTTIEQTVAEKRVILASGDLELRALTIRGGDASVGGGVFASDSLALDRVVVTDNHAGFDGGGIAASGGAIIQDSTIGPGNSAGFGGGGIFSQDSLSIERSVIRDNTLSDGTGGAIQHVDVSTGSDLTIAETTISGNTGAKNGGGISFRSDGSFGDLRLFRSEISGNQADFGGGGLEIREGDLVARNSTISGNTVTAGGVVSEGGGVNLSPATGPPEPEAALINVTVAGNSADDGSALLSRSSGDVEMFGSVLAGSCAAIGLGSFTSFGSNVGTDDSCDLTGPRDKPDTNPLLGPLAANGGLTRTHAIAANSPARDIDPTGVAGICGNATFFGHIDQRGVARPNGLACDAGAFELRPQDLPAPPPPARAAAPPPLPSSAFDFAKVKRNKKKGIAFLIVRVPGPGQVGLAGKGIKNIGLASAARKAIFTGGGRVKLRVKPTKKGKGRKIRNRLRTKGKAKVKMRVTYVPSGGTPNTRVRKLKLVKK